MNFEELIKPELLTLVPVLYVIGIVLKKAIYPTHLSHLFWEESLSLYPLRG